MTTTLTRSKTALKVHPAAEIFPMLNAEELDALALDIKANGLQDATNKRAINADAKLKPVFGKAQVTMFELAGIAGKHLRPVGE